MEQFQTQIKSLKNRLTRLEEDRASAALEEIDSPKLWSIKTEIDTVKGQITDLEAAEKLHAKNTAQKAHENRVSDLKALEAKFPSLAKEIEAEMDSALRAITELGKNCLRIQDLHLEVRDLSKKIGGLSDLPNGQFRAWDTPDWLVAAMQTAGASVLLERWDAPERKLARRGEWSIPKVLDLTKTAHENGIHMVNKRVEALIEESLKELKTG